MNEVLFANVPVETLFLFENKTFKKRHNIEEYDGQEIVNAELLSGKDKGSAYYFEMDDKVLVL